MSTKRKKVEKYAGIYYRDIPRLDGQGLERMYYVTYRRGGREAPVIEEPVGRASEGWTPAKVNIERSRRIAGGEYGQSNKERREAAKAELQKKCQTLEHLWQNYLATLADKPIQKRDDSGRAYYLSPLFAKNVNELTTADVDKLAKKLAKTQGKTKKLLSTQTQKHVLALLKRLLRYGERQGLCSYPQGLVITLPKVDNIKTETMTLEQLTAYWKALDEEPDKDCASILKIALLTGIRKSALLSLEWKDINFEQKILCLRGETAKSGKTQYIPLNATVIAIFSEIEHTESPLIWPSHRTNTKRKNIYNMARRVRDKAGLSHDFRPLHGLRHTFASHLASSGKVDLYTLQKLLTHGSPQMTQRYAHLADEALRRATDVADTMLNIK